MKILKTIILVALLASESSFGFTIKPGDILVADDGAGHAVKVDPVTGAQTSLGSFPARGVHDLELSPDGTLFVLEHVRRVTKIDVISGQQTELTRLGLLGVDESDTFVPGLTVGPGGDVFVSVYSAPYTGIIRVNKTTGQQTKFASGGFIAGPIGLHHTPNGNLLVGDVGSGSIIELNGITGAQRRVITGLPNGCPWALALSSDGQIFVGKDTPATGNSILQVSYANGSRSVFATGGSIVDPRGVAIDLEGNVISSQSNGSIVRINATTKAQTVVASGGFITAPLGVRVARIHVPSTLPELMIAQTVTLSWPMRNGPAVVESSPTLGEGAVWTRVDVPFLIRGDQITATVSTSPNAQYFRLVQ